MFKKIIPTLALTAAVLMSCGGSSEDPTPAPTPTPTPPAGGTTTGKFTKNVLIEDYTGTWCGYCPRVSYAIEQVQGVTTKSVAVAIHRGGSDPYNFSAASVLESQIGLTGYPTAMLNRTTNWNSPEPSYVNQVKNLTGTDANLGIAMKPTVNNGNISLDVKVKFAADMSNLKLVVYLLENDLVYNQTNYTSYYGGASTITGFDHDNVLRASFTNILGDAMSGATTSGTTWTKTFTQAMPANVSNAANVSFVAFVMDSTGKVLNVRKANINADQSFEVTP
ncbi:Omp28-related outer membrane protein [Amniculibacterium sp. G2-70]|uniref:Omp28-related outer membrane protein n=1 Tax=Amniculibacterium sp. G2-70 TaxID=2767188 RepID=UPI0016548658|nr:Omp28-related outer membrane protein [Amniculibacterium sp. G2-70]